MSNIWNNEITGSKFYNIKCFSITGSISQGNELVVTRVTVPIYKVQGAQGWFF